MQDHRHGTEGLLSFLLSLQKESGGTIPFDRFMAAALHHPLHGYYGAHVVDVGSRGDFSTSATLSERLGHAITAWALRRQQDLGWKRLTLIEVGAGNGRLAHTILRRLGWIRRLSTDYRIVESSPVLRESQRRLLGNGVQWYDSVKSALEFSKSRALLFSNELVDAFPCLLIEKQVAGWQELGLRITPEGALSEVARRTIHDPWLSAFDPLPLGQRVERHESYREWLDTWASSWKEGSLLTIDYGDLKERLYDRRPNGSLRAYWKHQRLTGRDLYARFGRQDMTADVNFSDLISWGEELGWRSNPLQTQEEFLSQWLSDTGGKVDPISENGGAGTAFKVLEQNPAPAGPTNTRD